MRKKLREKLSVTGIFSILFLITGCDAPYSMLRPAGPAAAEVAVLWWGMFWFFTLVWLAVSALGVYALFRKGGEVSTQEAQRRHSRWVIGGGIILPFISIVVILWYGIPAGHRMLPLPLAEGEAMQIHVTARQWQWDVYYPESGLELVNTLHIPAGVAVDVHLQSADVIHSFWVPRLAGKLDAIPGRTNILRLFADKAGTYHGQCFEYCGLEHAHMQFTVEAHPPEEFQRRMEREVEP